MSDYLTYQQYFPQLEEVFQLLPAKKDGHPIKVFRKKDSTAISIKGWMKENFSKLKNQEINDILHAFRKWY